MYLCNLRSFIILVISTFSVICSGEKFEDPSGTSYAANSNRDSVCHSIVCEDAGKFLFVKNIF